MTLLPSFRASLLVFFCFFATAVNAQTRAERKAARLAHLKSIIENQHFEFSADHMTGMQGYSNTLDAGYFVYVSKDSLISVLPYNGVANSITFDPTKSPARFNSVKFDYAYGQGDAGGWTINLKPKDYDVIQLIVISVANDASSTLQIYYNDRHLATFQGSLDDPSTLRK